VSSQKLKLFVHRKHHRLKQEIDMLVCQKSECIVLRTKDVSDGGLLFNVFGKTLPETFAVDKFVRTRADSEAEATAKIGKIVRLTDFEMAIQFV